MMPEITPSVAIRRATTRFLKKRNLHSSKTKLHGLSDPLEGEASEGTHKAASAGENTPPRLCILLERS
jgi:hypothetical protein